jgi:hypothetical protein
MVQRIKICLCGREIQYEGFVSRKDNKTPVCGLCALFEAAQEYDAWKQLYKRAAKPHRKSIIN